MADDNDLITISKSLENIIRNERIRLNSIGDIIENIKKIDKSIARNLLDMFKDAIKDANQGIDEFDSI